MMTMTGATMTTMIMMMTGAMTTMGATTMMTTMGATSTMGAMMTSLIS
jgi:hypothetical protein